LRKARDNSENKDDAKSNLIADLMQMAEWQIELQNPENAKACYHEVLEAEPDRYAEHYQILKIYLRTGQEECFRAALERLSKEKAKGTEPVFPLVFSDIFSAVSRTFNITQ
jgi:tetratricopeptide (TPR) repeat protein